MSRETDIIARCTKEFARVVDITGDFLKLIGPPLIHAGFFATSFVKQMKRRSATWKRRPLNRK